MAMYFLALDYGPDLINDVANQYINAINSGFGLIKGDVTSLFNVLIILSIMWSAALWALSDDHIIVQFARKIVYIGLFAWIIQNWQTLTDTLARSFMDLGLKAGGFDSANYYTAQPGNIAYLGYTTAQPLMDQIARLTGPVAFFKNFVEIAFLFLAICAIVAAFCVITIQVVVALLTFKFGSLAAFVLVPFAVLSKTAFIAERPLGWVVGSGVRLMVLTLVLGVGNNIFQELKVPPGQTVTTYQAFCIALAALLLMVLSLVASRLASDLIIGGPSLGVGTAINTSAMAINTTAATAEKARSAVKAVKMAATVPAKGIMLAGSAVAAAKAGATTQPTTDGFLNAIQYYDYSPGVVYTAITSPGYVTTIALRPNEKLITASAGDTVRWIVDSVQSSSGDTAQTLLIIKPRKAGLQTNLLITTDQRIYTLDLTSVDTGVYHTMIAWNYPFGDAVIIRNQIAAQQAAVQATVATGVDLSRANFNYSILRQKHSPTPPWCPLRAFDDGRKTYIQFPPKVAVTEAPPLFVMGRNGDAQLVNYRVKGDWYIVDRLFDKAELRLGQAPQTIVGIVRADAKD